MVPKAVREFYRDIGWDLDFDYVKPYVQPTGARKNVGIKYFRITGKTPHKQPCSPQRAAERAAGSTHDDPVAFRNRVYAALAEIAPEEA